MPLLSLSLKDLSMKTVMLLSLVTGQRLQTLVAIDIDHVDFQPGRCTIFINQVLKTTKPGQHIAPLQLPNFDTEALCPVRHLQRYLALTQPIRQPTDRRLLLSHRKPHRPVTTDTVSHWIKAMLKAAGVDTSVFAAHSTRGAATSAAVRQGAPLDVILRAACWRSAGTFGRFYHRDIAPESGSFGTAVLSAVTQ